MTTPNRGGSPPRYSRPFHDFWTPDPWLTYAIRAKHTGLIKIGKCKFGCEYARFKSAERLIGERCEWLGYLDVGETQAHRDLRRFWVWREWFEPTDEVADYILRLLCEDAPWSPQ